MEKPGMTDILQLHWIGASRQKGNKIHEDPEMEKQISTSASSDLLKGNFK